MSDQMIREDQKTLNLNKGVVLLDYVNTAVPRLLENVRSLINAEEWAKDKLALSTWNDPATGELIAAEISRLENIHNALNTHGDAINKVIESIKEK